MDFYPSLHNRNIPIKCYENIMFIYAFTFIDIATVHSIAAFAPIFVVILATLFLNERFSKMVFVATVFGCIGVLMILKPGIDIGYEVFVPLICMFLLAVYQILNRACNIRDSVESLGENVMYIQKWPLTEEDNKDYEWWKYYKRPEVNLEEFRFIREKSNFTELSAFVFDASTAKARESAEISATP